MNSNCESKWIELSEPAKRLLNVLVCLTITMLSCVFVIGYNNGNVLNTVEWIFWLFIQNTFMSYLIVCVGWILRRKKFSEHLSDENEVYAFIYFSHLFLLTSFKIAIENLHQSDLKEHNSLWLACWIFLPITPFLVLLLTLGCITFSQLRKHHQKNRISVRTVQPSENNRNDPEAGQNEAEEAEMDQPPPNYEDILLADRDLPNYEIFNVPAAGGSSINIFHIYLSFLYVVYKIMILNKTI